MLSSFSSKAKSLLKVFHTEIESRSMKRASGSAGIALLGQQLIIYENIFATLAQQMTEVINKLQRGANREFTPVIARNLSSAYNWCAQESGGGAFNRMKDHMSQHIDSVKNTMFSESCEEVKKLLLTMCKQVQQTMSENTDEVFIRIERDYLEVISGSKLPEGQMMPKFERKMRSDVAKTIEDREMAVIEETERGYVRNRGCCQKRKDKKKAKRGSGFGRVERESRCSF